VVALRKKPLYIVRGKSRVIIDIIYVTFLILASIYFRGEGNEFIYFQF